MRVSDVPAMARHIESLDVGRFCAETMYCRM